MSVTIYGNGGLTDANTAERVLESVKIALDSVATQAKKDGLIPIWDTVELSTEREAADDRTFGDMFANRVTTFEYVTAAVTAVTRDEAAQ